MTGTLRFVLGDQLSRSLSALTDLDPGADVVLLAEVEAETCYVPHHPQKVALILSAMRHFAADLDREGIQIAYRRLDDVDGACPSFESALRAAVARYRPDRVVVTWPGEWRVLEMMRGWQASLGIPVEIRPDDRFLTPPGWFARWAAGRRQVRMEYFYREMRRHTGLLMDGPDPVGGQWNFDADNRKPLPKDICAPPVQPIPPDPVTSEVLDLVERRFGSRFGRTRPFNWAVTRHDALGLLDTFISERLPRFGDYQDAMKSGQTTLYHSVLSPYLNIGLLLPREVCDAAERAWMAGAAPLNAVEGFIRQILGWREYVRELYWLRMPTYATTNHFGADRALPGFYWTGETAMRCLAESIGQIRETAYAHHIQRLMVTGTFALLAGIDPAAVNAWYLAVYADAFEWVELPNTHGMALFADGGVLASKPYAASGKYIDRMSDYCTHCAFLVKDATGDRACPFNGLYWGFLDRHRELLAGNPRMAMVYRSWDRMAADKRAAILHRAAELLAALDRGDDLTPGMQLSLT